MLLCITLTGAAWRVSQVLKLSQVPRLQRSFKFFHEIRLSLHIMAVVLKSVLVTNQEKPNHAYRFSAVLLS